MGWCQNSTPVEFSEVQQLPSKLLPVEQPWSVSHTTELQARRLKGVKDSQPYRYLWLGHPAACRKNKVFFPTTFCKIPGRFRGKQIHLATTPQWTSTNSNCSETFLASYISPSIQVSRRNSAWIAFGCVFFFFFPFVFLSFRMNAWCNGSWKLVLD